MSDTGNVSPEQMLAWLALEGYQAYEGSMSVGVWKGENAYWWWVNPGGDPFVDTHLMVSDGSTEYKWMGGVYERPIPGLERIYHYLQEHADEP